MNQVDRRDEIDLFVDQLLADPARAEELKGKLRDRLGGPETPARRRARLRLIPVCGDAEGLWNNVPV